MIQRKYREGQEPWGEGFHHASLHARMPGWGVGFCPALSHCLPTALIFPLASGPPTLAVQAKCDPCLSSPCQNQGTCHNDPLEVYRCACPSGYKVSGG